MSTLWLFTWKKVISPWTKKPNDLPIIIPRYDNSTWNFMLRRCKTPDVWLVAAALMYAWLVCSSVRSLIEVQANTIVSNTKMCHLPGCWGWPFSFVMNTMGYSATGRPHITQINHASLRRPETTGKGRESGKACDCDGDNKKEYESLSRSHLKGNASWFRTSVTASKLTSKTKKWPSSSCDLNVITAWRMYLNVCVNNEPGEVCVW